MAEVYAVDQPRLIGKELFEITPILVGGDPTSPQNKVWLTRDEHIQAVRYWNGLIRQLSTELSQTTGHRQGP